MDEMAQAHHELNRLQGIITRHEGFMFAVRGWLLTIVGGLLALYYTDNIEMSETVLRWGLPAVALLFLIVESRHINLVEAAVDRVWSVETQIATGRHAAGPWYDGPKVSVTCQAGAKRLLPRFGMTLFLNLSFYIIVIVVLVLASFWLPRKSAPTRPPAVTQAQPFQGGVTTTGSN